MSRRWDIVAWRTSGPTRIDCWARFMNLSMRLYVQIQLLFKDVDGKLSSAIPVNPDRVAIPQKAGTVDPLSWLPEDRREVVANLPDQRLPEGLWDEVVPACHRVPKREEARLVRKLLAQGMVTLVAESELPRTNQGKLLTGGFFCVKKSDVEDRLIYDRRPENATMSRLGWSQLPSGACLTRILLEPDEYLRGSGDDLKTYYYSLALPSNWIKYNSVGRRVAVDVVRDWGGDVSVPYRACMKVLGMGDTNACCIAQGVHEHILEQGGLLQPNTKMVYGQSVPDSNILDGAYLDDLLILHKKKMAFEIPLDGSFQPPIPQEHDDDMRRAKKAEDAYHQAGLDRALHKSFRGETSFKAWGAEVDGVAGTVGAPVEVRRQVFSLMLQVIVAGFSTKNILQRIMGYVCFAFQYRREYFALQHHIYKYIEQMSDKRFYRLPAYVLDELRSMLLHLPFCSWKMRRGFGDTILATDATPSSGGATRAPLPSALARELWKQCEVRGEAIRLDRTDDLPRWDDFDAPKAPSQFASVVAETLPWYVTASYHFRQTSHINLQETRALRREIALMAQDVTHHGTVQLCLNDSRVVVGAATKGRSSSFKLNGILRTLIPLLTISNIFMALLWVETKCNPADYPSRFASLPSPRPPPTWLQKLGVLATKLPGLEVFAGSARLTRSFIAAGCEMLDPVDILWGSDAFESWIEFYICNGYIGWLWLAPPCGTFSALRNLDRGGPLRPKGCPEGDENNPEVALGNRLWRRALFLAWLAWKHGIPFFLEHPQGSKAWLLKETQRLWGAAGVFSVVVDWCQYSDRDRIGAPNKKPTRILGTGGWLKDIQRRCKKDHIHGKPLRGSRAKEAGAYPWGFCEELATAYKQWYGEVKERGDLTFLSKKFA